MTKPELMTEQEIATDKWLAESRSELRWSISRLKYIRLCQTALVLMEQAASTERQLIELELILDEGGSKAQDGLYQANQRIAELKARVVSLHNHFARFVKGITPPNHSGDGAPVALL
jgi:hypothetical protein